MLTCAVREGRLDKVSLEGVSREQLLRVIPNDFFCKASYATTFAHQFGREGMLERIQHLLLPQDYDFEIRNRLGELSEPPLFCYCNTNESTDLLPEEIFTDKRLFSYYDAVEGDFVWAEHLALSGLFQRIPTTCLTKDKLLKPCRRGGNSLVELLIGMGQTHGIYPAIISSEDLITSERFPKIVQAICLSDSDVTLVPSDFASCYPALKANWQQDIEMPASAAWFKEVTKARIRGRK